MTYLRRTVRGVGIVFLMSLLAALFAYGLRVLLARQLTTAEFGMIYAIIGLFDLLALFYHLGLPTALVKYIPEFSVKMQLEKMKGIIITAFLLQIVIATVVGIMGILLSRVIAAYYLKDISASTLVIVYAIAIILSPIHNTFSAVFQGFQKMKYFSLVDFLKMVFVFALTAVFLIIDLGIVSPLLAYALVGIVELVIYIPLFRKTFPSFIKIKGFFSNKLMKKLLAFGIPITLISAAGFVFNYTDTVMLTIFRSIEEVGLYNAGLPTARLLWKLSAALAIVLMPVSSELWAMRDFLRLSKGINLLYKYTTIFIFPASLLMVIFPDIILNVVFGQSYAGAANMLRVFAAGSIIFTLASVNNSILSGIGTVKFVTKIMLGAAILNVIGNFILIPKYGINGAAFSTVFCFLLIFVCTAFKIGKAIRFNLPWKILAKIFLSGIIFAIIVVITKRFLEMNLWYELAISIGVGTIIYLALLFAFKIIGIQEIIMITRKVLRKDE